MHAPGNNIRPKQITLHDPEMLQILLNNYTVCTCKQTTYMNESIHTNSSTQ